MKRPVILDEWLTALRSGRYRQARKALAKKLGPDKPTSYCCLGVLQEACLGGVCLDNLTTYEMQGDQGRYDDIRTALITMGLIEGPEATMQFFIKMNDTDMMSFKEIADRIEARWSVQNELAEQEERDRAR